MFSPVEPDPLFPTHGGTRRRFTARSVTSFMRLMVDDARAEHATLSVPSKARVVRELHEHHVDERVSALEALLALVLSALAGEDSFADFSGGGVAPREAWRALCGAEGFWDSADGAQSGLAELLAGTLGAADWGAHLIERAPALGMSPRRAALWQARLSWLTAGADEGLAQFQSWMGEHSTGAGPGRRRGSAKFAGPVADDLPEALADLMALHLDRGDPCAAIELFGVSFHSACLGAGRGPAPRSREARTGSPPREGAREAGPERSSGTRLRQRLQQLERLARLATVDTPVLPAFPPSDHSLPIPRSLVELREDAPPWLSALVGRPKRCSQDPLSGLRFRAGSHDADSEPAFIVQACVPFLRSRGGFRPALRASSFRGAMPSHSQLNELAASWRDPGHPVQRLLIDGETSVVRAVLTGSGSQARLCLPAGVGALTPESMALARVPLEDACGEARGWLHLEFDHHFVPSRARLADYARRFAPLAARASLELRGRPVFEDCFRPAGEIPSQGAAPAPALAPGSERAAVIKPNVNSTHGPAVADSLEPGELTLAFRRFVASLGAKTSHRRWWGVVLSHARGEASSRGVSMATARLRPHASGGDGLPDPPQGGGLGALRALEMRGAFRFDKPDPLRSIHHSAASGWAVPLFFGQRDLGVVVMESQKRGDFRPADVARARDLARAVSLDFFQALFADQRRESAGDELCFAPDSPGFATFAGRLDGVLRCRRTVTLWGPRGAGKRTLAAWLHAWEGARTPETLAARDLRPDLLRAWASAEGSRLTLTGIEELDVGAQRELAELLAERARRDRGLHGRWIFTLRAGLSALVPELAAELDGLATHVPGLAARRCDVSSVAAGMLARSARREGLAAPILADSARALLWRQRWPNGWRDLHRVIARWALSYPGVEIDAERGCAAWSPSVVPPIPRLSPERASEEDVASAVYATRTRGGRVNKRRAALYLGWDPDTLAGRLRTRSPKDVPLVPQGWGQLG